MIKTKNVLITIAIISAAIIATIFIYINFSGFDGNSVTPSELQFYNDITGDDITTGKVIPRNRQHYITELRRVKDYIANTHAIENKDEIYVTYDSRKDDVVHYTFYTSNGVSGELDLDTKTYEISNDSVGDLDK